MKKIILSLVAILISSSVLQTMDDREYEQQIVFQNISNHQLVRIQDGLQQLNNEYYQNIEELKLQLGALESTHLLDNSGQNNDTNKNEIRVSLQSYIPAFAQADINMFELGSSFYHQAADICSEKIKCHQNMIGEHQAFYMTQQDILTNAIQNQDAYAQAISTRYKYAQSQLFGIKTFDPLIHDANLLHFIPIHPDKPEYRLLLLSHEYLTSQDLTTTRKWNIHKEIRPLLKKIYASCYKSHVFQPALYKAPYDPKNLIELSQELPDIYNSSWNLHKFYVTWHLLNMLESSNFTLEQYNQNLYHINTIQNMLAKSDAQCHDALLFLNQKTTTKIAYDNVVRQIASMKLRTTKVSEQEIQVGTKKTKIKNSPAIESKSQLSKKEIATLVAAEKKAEQSRIDKERHRLALEQKKAEEESKKLMPTITAATKNNGSKTTVKTLKKKTVVNEDDAILNAAIAENQKELITKKTSDEVNKQSSDLDLINQTLANIDEIFAQQAKSHPIAEFKITNTKGHRLHSQDIQEYQQFYAQKAQKFKKLITDKEIQQKENFKKILRTKAHERANLKNKLDKELTKKFNPISEEEYNILMVFKSYATILTNEDMQLEHFASAFNALLTKERELAKKNIQLKWYLASYPEIYNHIKINIIKLQNKLKLGLQSLSKADLENISEELTLEEQDNIQKRLDACDENTDTTAILDIVNILHTNDGILDISNILYQYKTFEEIDQLGRLTNEQLQNTHNIIKIMYENRSNLELLDFNKIKAPLQFLFILTGMNKTHYHIINDIISMATEVAHGKKSGKNVDIILYNLNPIIFNSLQCKNEMVFEPLTEDQIADITKINNMVHIALIEITESK